MTGYFERKPDEKSIMRVIVFVTTVTGLLIALIGTVLVVIVIIAMVNGNSVVGASLAQLILLVGGSLSVVIGSQGFKALQQRGEAKEANGG